jgi:DNA-binding NtrC family response regulator
MSEMSLIYFASTFARGSPRNLCDAFRHLGRARVGSACGRNSKPALVAVLSDINMPGMDGLELLGEIKQLRPDLPVMMVTGYGDDERRHRARELGAFEFTTKPVDFDQLKEQLRKLPSAAE